MIERSETVSVYGVDEGLVAYKPLHFFEIPQGNGFVQASPPRMSCILFLLHVSGRPATGNQQFLQVV